MENTEIKIKKRQKSNRLNVAVRRLKCGSYEVYFENIAVPIKMSMRYFTHMINKGHIGVQKVLM